MGHWGDHFIDCKEIWEVIQKMNGYTGTWLENGLNWTLLGSRILLKAYTSTEEQEGSPNTGGRKASKYVD